MKRAGFSVFLVSGLVLLTGTSFAKMANGGLSDGGGNLVVCFDSPEIPKAIRAGGGEILNDHVAHVTFLEAFDLYEAKLKRGFGGKRPELVKPKNGETFLDYARVIKTRLDKTIPDLGTILNDSAEKFPEGNIALDDHGLRKIDDVNASGLIDSVNCVLGTGIAQYQINDQYFLHIDERLFFHEKHSEWSKGVLLLHEYLYRHAREKGQLDSRTTRKLVGAIISNEKDSKLYKMIDLVVSLGFLERRDSEDLYYYAYAKPVNEYWDRLWWLRIGASMEFDEFEFHLPAGVTDAYTLTREAFAVLDELGIVSKAATVANVYATLRAITPKFSRLKEPKKAEELLVKLQVYLEERAKSVEGLISERIQDAQSKISHTYLSEAQNASLISAMRKVGDRMLAFARDYKTNGQVEWCRNRAAPGGIVFDTDVGVCEFDDFSMSIDLLNRDRCDARIKGASEWLRAQARHALFFDEHYLDWANAIPFPVID